MTELLKLYSIRHKPTGQWMASENMPDTKPDQRHLYATRKAAEAKIRNRVRWYGGFTNKASATLAKIWSECEAVELTLNLPSTNLKPQTRKMRNDDVFEVGRDRGWR